MTTNSVNLGEPDPLTDCSEVYRSGNPVAGAVLLDVSGSNDKNLGTWAYCDQGWTYILRRGYGVEGEVKRELTFNFSGLFELI